MSHLNQINHWNKPTQYKKQIKQFLILFIYLFIYLFIFWHFLTFFFFAIPSNSSSLRYAIYAINSEKEGQVDGTKNVFEGERLFEGDAWGKDLKQLNLFWKIGNLGIFKNNKFAKST